MILVILLQLLLLLLLASELQSKRFFAFCVVAETFHLSDALQILAWTPFAVNIAVLIEENNSLHQIH